MPDAQRGDGHHVVTSDDSGVSEWRRTGTRVDGSALDVFGCDFLTLRDRKIVRRSSSGNNEPGGHQARWPSSNVPM